jgi:hypothetical protein
MNQTCPHVLDDFWGEKLGNFLFKILHCGYLEISSTLLLDSRKDKAIWGTESVEVEDCQNLRNRCYRGL